MVCIFAEGAISRTGNMLPFKRGFERIVEGLDVPIVPVHLDRVWGSIFSFKGGKFFWKWPKRFPYPVTVAFGAPCRRRPPRTKCGRRSRSFGAMRRRIARPPATCCDRRFIRNGAGATGIAFAMADSTRPRADLRTRAHRRACSRAGIARARAGERDDRRAAARRRSAARSRTSR